MTRPTTSVVVVSQGRPNLLRRCLVGISQLWFPEFEVIVVADQAGLDAIKSLPFHGSLKTALFEDHNISAARNIGLSLAAGKVTAFIDDDAVPEPGWLFHLTDVFADSAVVASGGYVLGRNGISIQWKPARVSNLNYERDIDADGDQPLLATYTMGTAVKTHGTNCAFRTDALRQAGGFDPAFRFFLDETDLNMRLAKHGVTAIVPLAQVHHGYAASDKRKQNRCPVSLFDVGRSTAIFLRKYAPTELHKQRLDDLVSEHTSMLNQHLNTGGCEPHEVGPILATLWEGIRSGKDEDLSTLEPISGNPPNFRMFDHSHTGNLEILYGRRAKNSKLRAKAIEIAAKGHVTSVFSLGFTALFHKVTFCEDGYWLQTGGIWGRSNRHERLIHATTLRKRVATETIRIMKVRYPWVSGNVANDDVQKID